MKNTTHYIIATLFLLLLQVENLQGQSLALSDSLVLHNIRTTNCVNCPLNNPLSSSYWDPAQPASSWSGVTVGIGRLLGLNLANQGLTGNLVSLDDCDMLFALDCQGNSLSSLPSMNLPNLNLLEAQNNQLSAMGSLASCHSLLTLNVNENQLLSLPTLSNTLTEIYCTNNQLSSLPSLNGMSNLHILSCANNQLNSLPSLNGCTSLQTLSCPNNNLTSLPSLANCNVLEFFYCQQNNLTSLTNLDDCPDLHALICYENQLTSLPSLNHLIKLERLQCENNQLLSLPTLDGCVSLIELFCQNNQIQNIPSLDDCSALEVLYCENNQLTSLPNLDDCINLTTIRCQHNLLGSFPSTTSLTTLDILKCEHNALTFGELEPLASLNLLSFTYSPQANAHIAPDSILKLDTDSYVLDASMVGGDSTQYQWLLNGSSISNANTISLITNTLSGNGFYQGQFSNPLLPNLTLFTDSVHIYYDEGIKCGNTNQDTRWDMLDIAPIGLHYGTLGIARPNYQFEIGDTLPKPAYDWVNTTGIPLTFNYNGQNINLKHADCNGDGKLDSLDIECVKSYYQPLEMPAYLQSNIQATIGLKASVDSLNVQKLDSARIAVPFRIEVDQLPAGLDSVLVKGIVFTRPVAQNVHYSVDTIYASFQHSDLVPNPADAFWLQRFHRNISIQHDTTYQSCSDAVDNPLDVGVFNKVEAKYMKAGSVGLDCIVVLEDVFRIHNPANDTLDKLPVILHTYNTVMYVQSPGGQTFPVAVQCTSDTTYLDIDQIYLENILLPVELATIEGYRKEGASYIQWATHREENNHHFIIERSLDGQNFSPIGSLPGAGFDEDGASYVFVDEAYFVGEVQEVYYRVLSVDDNGSQHFLGRVTINLQQALASESFYVYPNPAEKGGALQLQCEFSSSQSVWFELLDISGKVLRTSYHELEAGLHEISFSLKDIAAGMYFMRMRGDTHSKPHKILIR